MDKLDEISHKRKKAHQMFLSLKSNVYESFLQMEQAAYADGALPKNFMLLRSPMNRCSLRLAACLSTALVMLALGRPLLAEEASDGEAIAVSGAAAPGMSALDEMMTSLMQQWEIPGGALAVVKDGRLVFAHGYGWADRDAGKMVQPDSLFRIASVSKPITAAAILVLVEQGRLDLDAKVLDILKPPVVPSDVVGDKRWKKITVRQLLQHTAGFDRERGFDPMFRSDEIAKATGTPAPADATAIIHYMLGRPLDFDPGSKYAYSNFGYCLLGRVIEQVTGEKYAEAVQNLVLQRCGITRMRIGGTRLSGQLPGEVRYYMPEKDECRSVFSDEREPVSRPYGGFFMEARDANGGWVASAIDLVRFGSTLDGSRKPGLLKPETVRLIESRSPPPLPGNSPIYYGLGWKVRPTGQGANWSHTGSFAGTILLLVRTHDGFCWAAVFNLKPKDDGEFKGELNISIRHAVGRVSKWPEGDLFSHY
jgi:N-acyl-D-amino-acid deacylase